MSESHNYTEELRSVKDDIKELGQDFKEFVKAQREHNQEIKQLLAGSEYGEDGLVKKQIRLEARVDVLESKWNKLIAYTIGVSAGSGGVVAGVIKLIAG